MAGELIQQCFKPEKKIDVHQVVDFLKLHNFEIVPTTSAVRDWCRTVDECLQDNYGSSVTDRTHLDYALAYEAIYFITSPGEVKSLSMTHFPDADLKVLSIDELKNEIS